MEITREKITNRRTEINAIDSEILELLNRRAEIALWLGAMKSRDDGALCDETREREVLDRLANENAGPLEARGVRSIFQRIIDEMLHLQQAVYQKQTKTSSNGSAGMI